MPCLLMTFTTWSLRRWLTAIGTGLITFAALGLSSAVIANPVFGRSIPPTSWAMTVLVMTSVLTGLLTATYVRSGQSGLDRRGTAGALLSYFAIGCPVCNKAVLLALGASGAVRFFAPVQPYLATAGVALLGWALWVRMRGETVCALPWSEPESGVPAPSEDYSTRT